MKVETYEYGEPPGGAELCCGMCGAVMHYSDACCGEGEDDHVCTNKDCRYILQHCFASQDQDPPTIGVNFGFARPNAYSIEEGKYKLAKDIDKHKWCVVEGSDAQFRLYMLD